MGTFWKNRLSKNTQTLKSSKVSHYTDHMDTAQSVNANAARKLASGKLNEWRARLGCIDLNSESVNFKVEILLL